jgi:hypothetical protein
MVELQKERDTLAKEKTALLQKLAAVTQASAEERKRLEQTYKDKLTSVERRLKDLAEREKAAKRNAAQLVSRSLPTHCPPLLQLACERVPDLQAQSRLMFGSHATVTAFKQLQELFASCSDCCCCNAALVVLCVPTGPCAASVPAASI